LPLVSTEFAFKEGGRGKEKKREGEGKKKGKKGEKDKD